MSALEFRYQASDVGGAARAGSAGDLLSTVRAWCMLALVDVMLKLAGFDRFYRMIARWPTVGSAGAPGEDRINATRAAIHRARTYYFKRAWCLQSAAAAVCCLRLDGVRAELVIGVRKMPFFAHAWVEVGGAVVLNEESDMRTAYRVIARC